VLLSIGDRKVPIVIDTKAIALDHKVVDAVTPSWPFISPMRLATIPIVSLGGTPHAHVRVAVSQGAKGNWPRSAKGLLGNDFLQTVAITIDYVGKGVLLRPAGEGVFEGEEHRVALTLAEKQPLRKKLKVTVDGIAGTMLFDTGNQDDAIITHGFQRENLQLAVGSAKASNGAPCSTRCGSIHLGDETFSGATVRFDEDNHDLFGPNVAGNLGCGLLQTIASFTINDGSRTIFFR
jgi:hypothetical protein